MRRRLAVIDQLVVQKDQSLSKDGDSNGSMDQSGGQTGNFTAEFMNSGVNSRAPTKMGT